MSAARVATRYAKALIGYLAEENALDQVDQFLDFCDQVTGNDGLVRVFGNVTVNAKAKAAIARDIAEKIGLPEAITRFIEIMAENHRLSILAAVREAVLRQMDERRNIRHLQLTVAVEPDSGDIEKLRKNMTVALGSDIRVATRVDPTILGGAVARVGSVVYDGSVRGHLEKLHKELVKEN